MHLIRAELIIRLRQYIPKSGLWEPITAKGRNLFLRCHAAFEIHSAFTPCEPDTGGILAQSGQGVKITTLYRRTVKTTGSFVSTPPIYRGVALRRRDFTFRVS